MSLPNVLMVGTGEYTTGYVGGKASSSDKGAGVVALTLFDLRRRGRFNRLLMCGTNGTKFPGIRDHVQQMIADRYQQMDVSFESFPPDTQPSDPDAYKVALAQLNPGDIVTIFTPDDTHFTIALDAIAHGCHVLVAKPLVKTLQEHLTLARAAREKKVLVAMEVHKRWDPIYTDARDQIRKMGPCSLFTSYMSQPKSQLDTFRAWAGKSSDISYYLNAHHVDFHVWSVFPGARPRWACAMASTGVASQKGIETEDTITISVQWENRHDKSLATAHYTSSWIAPKSDVHSQQRFFYMGHGGELSVDQAHRGYTQALDGTGFGSRNPLFMKYEPSADSFFAGQTGYGYRSIEAFVDAAQRLRQGDAQPDDFRDKLATAEDTALVTAILEAGRRSLDQSGRRVVFEYDEQGHVCDLKLDETSREPK